MNRRDADGEFQPTILTVREFDDQVYRNCVSVAERRKTVPPFDVLAEQNRWASYGCPYISKAHLKLRLPRER